MSGAASVSAPAAPWKRDAFLELCLGFPVLRLLDPAAACAAIAAIAAAHAHGSWMIEARVSVDRPMEAAALTQRGFRIVDTNVQLSRAARAADTAVSRSRMARPGDEPAVRAVAARAFSQTRFHCDARIPLEAASRIKEEWAANYFRGERGDWLVVAEDAAGVCGFNLVLRGPRDSLVIDLIAVAERGRRSGIGAELIEFAALTCLGRAADVTVGTQIANMASLSLYTRLGFRPTSAYYIFHLHSADLIP